MRLEQPKYAKLCHAEHLSAAVHHSYRRTMENQHNIKVRTNIMIQSYTHTNIQTYQHTNIKTYKHTNIQTYKHTNIQTQNIQTGGACDGALTCPQPHSPPHQMPNALTLFPAPGRIHTKQAKTTLLHSYRAQVICKSQSRYNMESYCRLTQHATALCRKVHVVQSSPLTCRNLQDRCHCGTLSRAFRSRQKRAALK